MKLLVIGNSGCGKSTAAQMMAEILNTSARNTSDFLIEQYAREQRLPVEFVRENKSQFRQQLYDLGREGQAKDPLYVIRGALQDAGVLTGVRNPDELAAARKQNLFDAVLWIEREGCDPNSTDKLTSKDADITVDNNGTLAQLRSQLQLLLTAIQVARSNGVPIWYFPQSARVSSWSKSR